MMYFFINHPALDIFLTRFRGNNKIKVLSFSCLYTYTFIYTKKLRLYYEITHLALQPSLVEKFVNSTNRDIVF